MFSILILGQNVVSYNVQNELRLVKKGFPLRYSLKEITMQVSYWNVLVVTPDALLLDSV